MQVMHPNCAGIDVHKRDLKLCAVRRDAAGQRIEEIRTFGTMTQELEALGAWLRERGISVVAIESTGVYWKPVFNLLEAGFQVLLVNPSHCKQVPGRKTSRIVNGWPSCWSMDCSRAASSGRRPSATFGI